VASDHHDRLTIAHGAPASAAGANGTRTTRQLAWANGANMDAINSFA
jgi:hypothetical protein